MKVVGRLAPADTGTVETVPAGVAHISVLDTSRADAAARVVGDTIIGLDPINESFPIGFEIDVDDADLGAATHSHAIRAVIRDALGQLRWTTDTVYTVDLSRQSADELIDVGVLSLVAVGRRLATSAGLDILGAWTVLDIDGQAVIDERPPVIEFASDGTVAGTTGCNRFHATWTVGDKQLTIGPAASTRRACIPPLDQQEAAMLAALADAAQASVVVTADTLTIDTPGAHRLVAKRQR